MIHPIPTLQAVTRSRDPRDRSQLLSLDRNEWPEPLPPELMADLLGRLRAEDLNGYPTLEPLYRRMAAALQVEPAQLLLGAGSDNLIGSLFQVFGAGQEVLTLSPSYAMYEVYARMFGSRLRRVEFGPGRSLDPDRLLAALEPPVRLVTLANPNQPTGTVLGREVLEPLLERARRAEAVVMVDEAYYHFHGQTAAELIGAHPHLVVVRTFSKAQAMAGVRVGFALGQPEVIGWLEKVRATCEINALAARALEFTLDHPQLAWDNARASAESQERLAQRLRVKTHRCPANFMLLETQRGAELVAALERRGILLKGPFEHPSMAGLIRVSTGPWRIMERFAEAFDGLCP